MSLTPQPIPGSQPGVQLYSRIILSNTLTNVTDATFVDVFKVTVPNLTCVASIFLEGCGALGDSDSVDTRRLRVGISRIAGAATITAIATDAASATTGAGGNSALTAQCTGMTGAVGATQTFTIQMKVTKSAGSSANHTIMASCEFFDPMSAGVMVNAV